MTLTGFALRNVRRNKVRLILTVFGVAMTVLTFVFLRTVLWSWTVKEQFAAKDRIVTRHKSSFVIWLPKRYVDDVRGAPHVKSATWANWFGGTDPAHDKEFFACFAVDPKSYLEVYDELSLPADQKQAWFENRKGAIVGDQLAKKLGWTVGQTVNLESGVFPELPTWQFQISGIYTSTRKSADRNTFFLHWDYVNENVGPGRKDEVGIIAMRIDDPRRTAEVSMAIDRMFEEKEAPTLSQDEHTFESTFLAAVSSVLATMNVVSMAILVIMTLITGNTIAMGVRERTSEYGTLLAIGFLPRQLAGFVLLEAMTVGLLGGSLGLLIAYPLIERGVGAFLEENMSGFFPYFRISLVVAVLGMVAPMVVAAVGAIIPAFKVTRLKVVDALRHVA